MGRRRRPELSALTAAAAMLAASMFWVPMGTGVARAQDDGAEKRDAKGDGGSQAAPLVAPSGERVEPFQLSLVAPAQIMPESASIAGFRLTLFYGSNENVAGFELLLAGVNRTRGDFVGVSWSWIGASWVEGSMIGLQNSLVNIAGEGMSGVQLGVVNVSGGESVGVGVGGVNVTHQMDGFALGFVNVADTFHGLQMGVVNVARRLRGVQIGLVNVILEGPLPFFVIANASFR